MIKLAEEGRTTREIAKEVRISLKSIGKILNKVTGDNKEDEEKQKLVSKSDYAKAFKMFKDGRPLEDVAIELDIETPTVLCYYEDYLKIVNMRSLVSIYKELKGDLPLFLHLFRHIKKEGLNKQNIAELLEHQHLLLDLRTRVDLYNNHIWGLHAKKLQMEKEIGKLTDVLV